MCWWIAVFKKSEMRTEKEKSKCCKNCHKICLTPSTQPKMSVTGKPPMYLFFRPLRFDNLFRVQNVLVRVRVPYGPNTHTSLREESWARGKSKCCKNCHKICLTPLNPTSNAPSFLASISLFDNIVRVYNFLFTKLSLMLPLAE